MLDTLYQHSINYQSLDVKIDYFDQISTHNLCSTKIFMSMSNGLNKDIYHKVYQLSAVGNFSLSDLQTFRHQIKIVQYKSVDPE